MGLIDKTDPAVLWKSATTFMYNGTGEGLRNARACLSKYINLKLEESYKNDLARINHLIVAHARLISVIEKLIDYAKSHQGGPEFQMLGQYQEELTVVRENWEGLQMEGAGAAAAPAGDAPPVYATDPSSNEKPVTFQTLLTDAHNALKKCRMRDAIDIFEKKLRLEVFEGEAAQNKYRLTNHTMLFSVKLEMSNHNVTPQDLTAALLSKRDYFVTSTREKTTTLYIQLKGDFFRLLFKTHHKNPLMICFLICEYLG